MTMPDEIELPRADDFCKRALRVGALRCSLGWADALGFTRNSGDNERFETAWLRQAKKGRLPASEIRGVGITEINDHPDTTYEQLADAFEATVVDLGYEVSDG